MNILKKIMGNLLEPNQANGGWTRFCLKCKPYGISFHYMDINYCEKCGRKMFDIRGLKLDKCCWDSFMRGHDYCTLCGKETSRKILAGNQ